MLLVLSVFFGCLPFCRGRKNNFAGEIGFGIAATLAFLTGAGYILYLCGGGETGRFLLYIPYIWGAADLVVRCEFWKKRVFALRKTPPGKAWIYIAFGFFFLLLFFLACEKNLPCGWDPAFHAILAEKILRTGELSRNWLPFENIPLNYPQGIHLLTAIYAGASGITVPAALKILMFVFSLGETLLLAGLAVRAFPGKKAGLYTAAAYVALGGMAVPVNFWGWGGYPTAACFLYFSALLFGVWHYRKGDLRLVFLLFLWGALALTHLLGLLFVLLAMGFWTLFLLVRWKRKGIDWKNAPGCRIFRELFFSGLLGFLTFLPCLIYQYFISGGAGAKSDAFYFTEEPLFTFGKILEDGNGIFLCGAAGVILFLVKERKKKIRSLPQYLLIASISIFMIFLFLGVPFRKWIALPLTGEEFSILVPSRFMSFSCLILAVFAGYFLNGLVSAGAKLSCWKYLEKAVLAGLLLWGAGSFYLKNTGNFSTGEALRRCEELKRLLPERSYIIVDPSRIPYAHWIPYILWKPCVTNPIPASEDRTPVRKAIALFLETPGSKMDPALIKAFEKERGCRIYYAVIPAEGEKTSVKIFPALMK